MMDEAIVFIEREIWKKAIRSVKCILPDDAEDVEAMVSEIRIDIMRQVSNGIPVAPDPGGVNLKSL